MTVHVFLSLFPSLSGFATDLLHLQTVLSENQHGPIDKNWCFYIFIFPSPFPLKSPFLPLSYEVRTSVLQLQLGPVVLLLPVAAF